MASRPTLDRVTPPGVTAAALLVAAAALVGCAPTNVKPTYERESRTTRPQQVIVYDFAVSPDEVQLDRGLEADVTRLAEGTSPSADKLQIAHAAAQAASEQLVQKINAMGMPAIRATGMPLSWYDSAVLEGQFVSLSQGSSTERDLIGLGFGRSDVRANVQLYDAASGKLVRLASFQADAKSGYKPGMAETMGAGAAAGHLAVSAAVSVAGDVGSELLSDTVKADAERLADAVAKQLQPYFAQQGWIPPQP
ncbi:MAG TPA: DUF4410 domain-containing protein [Myxococcota bacterium]|jgi:hypothetical protein|nr:DUF4410 domain-containing protein [Myxococcota bacterium]